MTITEKTTVTARRPKDNIDTTQRQFRRADLVLRHVARLGPAMRQWLLSRLAAEECSEDELLRLRVAGHR